jgi:hypothetical protein
MRKSIENKMKRIFWCLHINQTNFFSEIEILDLQSSKNGPNVVIKKNENGPINPPALISGKKRKSTLSLCPIISMFNQPPVVGFHRFIHTIFKYINLTFHSDLTPWLTPSQQGGIRMLGGETETPNFVKTEQHRTM